MIAKIKKTSRQLERHFKGVANHWRVDILSAIAEEEGITVENISDILECNLKTASQHILKLHHAGLIYKKYQGRTVGHSLSPYGKKFISFITSF